MMSEGLKTFLHKQRMRKYHTLQWVKKQTHKNKKKYSRKEKHKSNENQD